MNIKKVLFFVFLSIPLFACVKYTTPPRNDWPLYLRGASFTDMTETARVAKRPVYLGAGGRLATTAVSKNQKSQYGDKSINENTQITNYMAVLEYELYDSLRKPGISVQRAGTDVVIILVRDALMELDAPEFSDTGTDTLLIISKILQKYDATFIEIAGYTDAMRDQNASRALSLDMAQRVSIYLSQNKIITARMFIIGRGSARPIAAQDDVGRLTNRRVEIRITPAR